MRGAEAALDDELGSARYERQATCERSNRILDVTLDLVLRVGYPKVNVQDIADEAKIGKGTVYLHWNSKEDILDHVLRREYDRLCHGYLTQLAQDPSLVLVSGAGQHLFTRVMASPLLRAFNTSNAKLLGQHTAASGRPTLNISLMAMLTGPSYLGLLHRHGLVFDDVSTPGGRAAIEAVVSGFVGTPDHHNVAGLERGRSRLLCSVLHRAFEPQQPPSSATLRAAAGAVFSARQWPRQSSETTVALRGINP